MNVELKKRHRKWLRPLGRAEAHTGAEPVAMYDQVWPFKNHTLLVVQIFRILHIKA